MKKMKIDKRGIKKIEKVGELTRVLLCKTRKQLVAMQVLI